MFSSSYDLAYRRLILQASRLLSHTAPLADSPQAMQSFTLIPLAARSLVFHQGFIPWLSTQWTASCSQDAHQRGRNPKEDQGRLLELLENVVVACVAEETRGAVRENTDANATKPKKPTTTAQPQWVYETAMVVRMALADAGEFWSASCCDGI